MRRGIRLTICLLLFLVSTTQTHAVTRTHPIIIDHTSISQFTQILPEYLNEARTKLSVSFGHTSHGSQIISGMRWLAGRSGTSSNADFCSNFRSVDATKYSFCDDFYYYKFGNLDNQGVRGYLSLWDAKMEEASDLGNPNFTAWVSATRNALARPNNQVNVVIWSWCGQVSTASEADIANYLANMNQLEQTYPHVTFIYMTGHLDGTGPNGNLYKRNNQIREYVRANNKVLFDFADIESYDPAGTYYPNGSDACQWCSSWCSAHPSDCATLPSDCAHSHRANCAIKGKAFWVLLAKLAGWGSGVAIEPTRSPLALLSPSPLAQPPTPTSVIGFLSTKPKTAPAKPEELIAQFDTSDVTRDGTVNQKDLWMCLVNYMQNKPDICDIDSDKATTITDILGVIGTFLSDFRKL